MLRKGEQYANPKPFSWLMSNLAESIALKDLQPLKLEIDPRLEAISTLNSPIFKQKPLIEHIELALENISKVELIQEVQEEKSWCVIS